MLQGLLKSQDLYKNIWMILWKKIYYGKIIKAYSNIHEVSLINRIP